MSLADQIRADRAAAREQARVDRRQAAELALEQARLVGELALAREAQAAEIAGKAAAAEAVRKADAKKTREDKRDTKRAARAAWLKDHRPDLLIYALWLVSAALAVPAMAAYGISVYGPLGAALFVLSEAGAAAFAFAVQARRAATARDGEDRPTAMLTVGIGLFATVGAGLNFLHGISGHGGVARGVVMAIVSVAGIVAHQLVVAAPPRTRAQRAAARQAHRAARQAQTARRLLEPHATYWADEDGAVLALYPAGEYALRRRWTGRLELTPVTGSAETTGPEADRSETGPTGSAELTGSPDRLALTGPETDRSEPANADRSETPAGSTDRLVLTGPPRLVLTAGADRSTARRKGAGPIGPRPGRPRRAVPIADLLPAAREVAALLPEGAVLTKTALMDGMRARNQSLSSDRARELLAAYEAAPVAPDADAETDGAA